LNVWKLWAAVLVAVVMVMVMYYCNRSEWRFPKTFVKEIFQTEPE
jgi:ABC-type uncharacterized transport system permease subunit